MTDERPIVSDKAIAEAKAMWATAFWQRVRRSLIARRAHLLGAVQPPDDTRLVWIREGAVAEINRMLRGDAFLLDVIAEDQKRRAAEDLTVDEESPPPPWAAGFRSDVVN